MKKVVVLLAAMVASLSLVASTASASGSPVVVYSGFACAIYGGDGSLFITYNSTTTVYSNQQGTKAVMRCEGNGPAAPSLTYHRGFLCNTQFGLTTNTVDKIGRNGNSQMTCTVELQGDLALDSSGSMGAVG